MFPAFYKSIRSNLVVMATSSTNGIVVVGNNHYKLGYQSLTWVDFNNNWDWIKIEIIPIDKAIDASMIEKS